MNSQYTSQQQFGLSPQNFPGNRTSGSVGSPVSQSFQNIPLGLQKSATSQQPPGPISHQTSSPDAPMQHAESASEHFSSNLGLPNANVRSQVPPSQLPPMTKKDATSPGIPPSQFGPPPTSKTSGPAGIQNGPPQSQNGPSSIQNGPGFGPPPITHGQPSSIVGAKSSGPPQQGPNSLGQNNQPQFLRTGQPLIPNQSTFNHSPSGNQASFNNSSHNSQFPFGQLPPNNTPLSQSTTSNQPLTQSPPSSQPFTQPPPSSQTFPQPPLGMKPISPPMGNQSLTQPPPVSQPLNQFQQPSTQPAFGQQSSVSSLPSGNSLPLVPGLSPPGPIPNKDPPMLAPPGPPQFNLGQQPNQFNQGPPLNRPVNQPPMAGQPPMSGQPPLPGIGQQLMAGHTQPSAPSQPPLGPNYLATQMQGMNLGHGRQYSSNINGNNGPHMPPPLNQQQYINGQQMRTVPAAGFPPMPSPQSTPAGGVGTYPQPAYQQPQQARRLDPDQMPSPIQVTQDDQQNRSGIFSTNQKGLVPPLVTTNFIVQDQGNTSPRFIRSSMYNVPISQDIMKQTAVPFSLVISPMARTVDQEYPPPIVNFGDLGPVRCIRCKAYMCPFMQFIDSGRRFQCLFCKATTDVPAEYFQHLDHTGQRLDRYERPELVLGTYEFVATQEYCRNNTLPKPPAIVFVIDVSYNNVKSGLVHLLCSQIKDIIQNLPVDQGQEKSNMRVGFITYNSSVHFYNIKGNLAAPQMLIVGDTQEMFMPLLDGFLCTPEESGSVIDSLMQQIPAMFGDTRETETILLPAILAGLEALKASECTGKLLVFHSSLPTAESPGKLKNRDDRKLLATDKERTILTPQTQAYNQLGQDCVAAGCSVDLFLFNNAYIDIATIGQVSRLTGGEVHKYTYFQADIDGERLVRDIITNISQPIAFDAIMRVRTSTGVRPTDFYGHFFMSNTTDMELAAIDCNKAIAVEVKHDDKLSEEEGVYIQAALLYTSCSGQRRLRVMNLSLKTCSQMADLYRNCDCDTIINYISKQSTYKLFEHSPKAVKDSIVTRAAQILATYRKNCASPSSAGQLILPECMKLLPLYVNCLLKNDALSGGSDMTVDDRSYIMQEVMIMDIPTSVNFFYPRLIPLIDLDPTQDPVEIPASIRCTIDKMNEQGVYILENGIHMFLWIGLGANPNFIQQVFGVPSAIQVDIEKVALPELDNPLSIAVRNIIEEIRIQRHKCMRLTIVRQREKLEPVFKHFLAEDRGTDGSPSYVDFLIHMHKEIRSLLS